MRHLTTCKHTRPKARGKERRAKMRHTYNRTRHLEGRKTGDPLLLPLIPQDDEGTAKFVESERHDDLSSTSRQRIEMEIERCLAVLPDEKKRRILHSGTQGMQERNRILHSGMQGMQERQRILPSGTQGMCE
jgi:hypothetical protein